MTEKKFFDTSRNIAISYGFDDINNVFKDTKLGKKNKLGRKINLETNTEEIRNIKKILSWFVVNEFQDNKDKIFSFYNSNISTFQNPLSDRARKNDECAKFTLTLIGVPTGIAEAILMKTGVEILKDLGVEDMNVMLNSVGDLESLTKYERACEEYILKNCPKILSACKSKKKKAGKKVTCDEIKKVCKVIENNEEYLHLREKFPSTLRFLSDSSQEHFRFVIECIEKYNIVYEPTNNIMGSSDIVAHTLFKINTDNDPKKFEITGGRYDNLGLSLFNQIIPIASMTIEAKDVKVSKTYKPIKRRKSSTKVFFIHLGAKSQVESFLIMEKLRKENILVSHKSYMSKFVQQYDPKDDTKYQYILILGEHELNENLIIVRNIKTRSQKTIPINDVIPFLRRLHS